MRIRLVLELHLATTGPGRGVQGGDPVPAAMCELGHGAVGRPKLCRPLDGPAGSGRFGALPGSGARPPHRLSHPAPGQRGQSRLPARQVAVAGRQPLGRIW